MVKRPLQTGISLLAACVLLWGFPGVNAEAPASTEYKVKASYLFNFARFVEWPAAAFPAGNSPLTIGILGDDPFGPFLDELIKGETAKGRPLTIKRARSMAALDGCHILFISRSEKERIPKLLAGLGDAAVLTVSDTEGFCQSGGIVNFKIQRDRVRLEINRHAETRARLKISADLLDLAEIVREESR